MDIEKIRQDALEAACKGISDDIYGKVTKSILEKSSEITAAMLKAVFQEHGENHQ